MSKLEKGIPQYLEFRDREFPLYSPKRAYLRPLVGFGELLKPVEGNFLIARV